MMRLAIVAAAVAATTAADAGWSLTWEGEIVHATSLEVLGHTFRDVSAVPRRVDGATVLDQIDGRGYGGAITGSVVLTPAAGPATPARISGELAVRDIDLATYLRSLGVAADLVGGTASGWMRFRMTEGRVEDLTGDGELRIERGTLVQFNWLQQLIAGDPSSSRGQDQARVRFDLGPDPATGRCQIRILQAQLASPAVEVVASGTIDLDWRLDLVLQASPDGGILNQTVGWAFSRLFSPVAALARNILTYRVRGRLTDPAFDLRPFGG
jgi:hypothetical protein